MANASAAALTVASEQPLQPGLGDLSKLPLEVRRDIWQHFLPKPDDALGLRRCCMKTNPSGPVLYPWPTDLVHPCGSLAVICASKDLYNEITEELYRKRVLTICFNEQGHRDCLHHNVRERNIFYTTIGGICDTTDLTHVDLSRFSSVKLNILFPLTIKTGTFRNFNSEIERFTRFVQTWQTQKSHAGLPPSLQFDILVGLRPELGEEDVHDTDVCLVDVVHALHQLGWIQKRPERKH